MMKMKRIAFSSLMAVLVAGAAGGDDGAANKEEGSKLDKALVKYERTGEMKRCLNPVRIRRSRVVDDHHIIFEVSRRQVYLNTLPRKCHSLGFHKSIKYTVRGSSICKNDLFEVFDSIGIPGPHCSFGEFEKLDLKKDKDEKKKIATE